tara:strand:+ start:1233 stop:1451 length:219 start_codon:yes stop_codon:yes gene_type:complete
MIETVIALLMFLNGDVIEHTYKDKMSECMKSKRMAEREVNPQSVRFSCRQIEAETEVYMGAKKILRIVTLTK